MGRAPYERQMKLLMHTVLKYGYYTIHYTIDVNWLQWRIPKLIVLVEYEMSYF